MLRAVCLVRAVLMLATGQTPFELAGLSFSANGVSEMAVSMLTLVAALGACE